MSVITSSETSLSEKREAILLNSKLNSPKEIFLPFTLNGEFVGAEGSVKNPPKVATRPNISMATIIEELEEERPFRIL